MVLSHGGERGLNVSALLFFEFPPTAAVNFAGGTLLKTHLRVRVSFSEQVVGGVIPPIDRSGRGLLLFWVACSPVGLSP